MEAAPQLVLQIYIIVTKKINFEKFDFLETVQIISIFGSWVSLATAMATFHRAQRFSQLGKGTYTCIVYFTKHNCFRLSNALKLN